MVQFAPPTKNASDKVNEQVALRFCTAADGIPLVPQGRAARVAQAAAPASLPVQYFLKGLSMNRPGINRVTQTAGTLLSTLLEDGLVEEAASVALKLEGSTRPGDRPSDLYTSLAPRSIRAIQSPDNLQLFQDSNREFLIQEEREAWKGIKLKWRRGPAVAMETTLPSGKKVRLGAGSQAVLNSIRKEANLNHPVTGEMLYWEGKQRRGYNIQKESTLHLVLRIRGGMFHASSRGDRHQSPIRIKMLAVDHRGVGSKIEPPKWIDLGESGHVLETEEVDSVPQSVALQLCSDDALAKRKSLPKDMALFDCKGEPLGEGERLTPCGNPYPCGFGSTPTCKNCCQGQYYLAFPGWKKEEDPSLNTPQTF